jgi:hypothetical protein
MSQHEMYARAIMSDRLREAEAMRTARAFARTRRRRRPRGTYSGPMSPDRLR